MKQNHLKQRHLNSRGRWGGRSGLAMMEFAIGSLVLTTVFAGTFQFGYMFYQYNLLEDAVVTAAHWAAQYTYVSTTSTPSSDLLTKVQNMTVYGDPTGTNTTPVVPNLTTANVNFTVTMSGSGTQVVPGTMTVAIGGGSATNFTINGIFPNWHGIIASFTANGKPTATYPFQGVFAPDPTCSASGC